MEALHLPQKAEPDIEYKHTKPKEEGEDLHLQTWQQTHPELPFSETRICQKVVLKKQNFMR